MANSPWASGDGWRLNQTQRRRLTFTQPDREYVAVVEYRTRDLRISVGPAAYVVSGELRPQGRIDAIMDGQRVHATVILHQGRSHVFHDGQLCVLTYVDPLEVAAEGHSKESSLLAPMPGRVIAQMVQPGDPVEKGAPLMILEAMKMEYTIHAPVAGKVESFHFAVGDQVNEGAELLHFNRDDSPADEN
jgi:3-methylcrotonyl-CoA carboxylase alpha subunit